MPSVFFTAVVRIAEVSVPAVGSVMPKACRRSSPFAIFGRYFFFCASLQWRSTVPMVYICAWQAAPFAPLFWISSRIAAATLKPRPAPPYSSGMRQESQPASVSARTNSVG